MSEQLDEWSGEFGAAYTDRNPLDWRVRLPAITAMLDGLDIESALEVGCNRGHNLRTLVEILGEGSRVAGIDPNAYALELAARVHPSVQVGIGDAYALPFGEGEFDLVLTAGVLIHVPPAMLSSALNELYRVSRRYILSIEYYAEAEQEVAYRDRDAMLWKRPFDEVYRTAFPSLGLVRSGYVAEPDGFDRSHWWLFEKR